MRVFVKSRLWLGVSMIAAAGTCIPTVAHAQVKTMSQPAMPLDEALRRIAQEWGKPLQVDPDAVAGLSARPVVNARSERDAVAQATKGLRVAVQVGADGAIYVLNDIVVTASRDEAETSVIVRGATTSSRLGQSLRDQARNTQVISSKLIEEQQALTISEALANAGGVTVTSTSQGGPGFLVRGFAANGSVNGLPSTSNNQFAAGTSQPIANIERIEVLKGPDAILLGGDNLGGTINIVTKKPSAEERLYVTAETGSFGFVRGTVDADQVLTEDRRLSARVIAAGSIADRNFGGYRGNEDYLFAPSIRYKNDVTDIILSATIGLQRFGMTPFTVLDLETGEPIKFPRDRPLVGDRNQGARNTTTQFNADITQKVTDWLTVVARGQHQKSNFSLNQYSLFTAPDPDGIVILSGAGTRQTSRVDAVDTYARMQFDTGPLQHKIVGGFTHVDSEVVANNDPDEVPTPYNLFDPTALPLPPQTRDFVFGTSSASKESSFYGQYLLKIWKLNLMAGLRHTKVKALTVVGSTFTGTGEDSVTMDRASATTPTYGIVFDVADNLSLFGSLAYGFRLTFSLDADNNRLPNIKSRNAEAGVKWDLFHKRMLVTASYFDLKDDNVLQQDPTTPGRFILGPGQRGRGVDINVSGEPIRGLSLVAAFTHTGYDLLAISEAATVVTRVPRDIYSFYASYSRPIARDVTAGLGASVQGQSGSYIDQLGLYRIGPQLQTGLNGFLTVGRFDINVSIRNLFDREDYSATIAESFIPLVEPRNWRLSVGYKF